MHFRVGFFDQETRNDSLYLQFERTLASESIAGRSASSDGLVRPFSHRQYVLFRC